MMKKRMISITLTICMLLSAMPLTAFPSHAETIGTAIGGNIGNYTISASGSYYLSGDTVGNIIIAKDVTATLDLKGHVLKAGLTEQKPNNSVITNSGTLTVTDSEPEAVHYFTYVAGSAWKLDAETPEQCIDLADFSLEKVKDADETKICHIKVTGGIITGGTGTMAKVREQGEFKDTNVGGGIYNTGSVTMTGGSIVGNTAGTGTAGGVFAAEGSSYTMNGGAISGNYSKYGGPVTVHDGTFIINNGRIAGNTGSEGGGLFGEYGSELFVNGGKICENSGRRYGVGYIGESSLTIKKGLITGNSGGQYGALQIRNSTFLMTGGEIAGNTARCEGDGDAFAAGGIAITGKEASTIGGTARISGNKTVKEIKPSCYFPNLLLGESKQITVAAGADAPEDGMEIGVSLASEFGYVTAEGSKDCTKYFSSDFGFGIVNEGEGASQQVCIPPAAENTENSRKYVTVQRAIDSSISDSSSFKMLNDSNEDLTIGSGRDITLDMNGHVLTGTGKGPVITNEGKLKLTDSAPDTAHTGLKLTGITGAVITGGNAENGGAVYNTGKLTATGITFTGNEADKNGGAIYGSADAQVLLNGCRLSGNTAGGKGGAICMAGGKADMKKTSDKCVLINTQVSNNQGASGGGVYYKRAEQGTGITVSFDANGGSLSGAATKTCYPGEKYGELPGSGSPVWRVTRSGYTFQGWYTEADGGDQIDGNTQVTAENDHTLYAHWEEDKCFAAGTLITMADGTARKIEEISEGDAVKTFDHESGTVSAAKVYLAYKGDTQEIPFTLVFDNGTELSVAGCHDLLEKEGRRYVTITEENADSFIGRSFYGEDGQWHQLLSAAAEDTPCDYYSIYTSEHQNCFANGLLSVPDDADYLLNIYELDENLKADGSQLEADIAVYGLMSYEYARELSDLSREWYDAGSVKYMNIAMGKGLIKLEEALELYDSVDSTGTSTPDEVSIRVIGDVEGVKQERTLSSMFGSAVDYVRSLFVMTAYAEEFTAAKAYTLEDFDSGVLTIGSGTAINGNTANSKNDNVYLADEYSLMKMHDNSLDSNAVGVTTASAPTATVPVQITVNGTADDKALFFADKAPAVVRFHKSGYLELAVGFTVTEAVCGNGKVSVGNKNTYFEGETVTVTAAPDEGYVPDAYKAYKTGEASTAVVMSGNTFTMPAYDVTVSAEFVKAHKHDNVTFDTKLTNATLSEYLKYDTDSKSYYLQEGSYYLGEDLNLTKTLKIFGVDKKSVNLCLNGHEINAENVPSNGADSGAALRITAKGSDTGLLNLYDCDTAADKGCVTGAPGCGIWLECGKLQFNGGTVTGNARGISVQGGCSLSLSGNATVTGNDGGNLSLSLIPGVITNPPAFEKITVSETFTGNIGITLRDQSGSVPNVHYGVFTTANTMDLHEKFSSDLAGFSIVFNTDKCLEVLEPATVTVNNQKGTVLKTITGQNTGHKITLPTELKTGYDFKEYSYDVGIISQKIQKGGEFVIPEKATVLKAEVSIAFRQQPAAKQPEVATDAAGVSFQWYERETVADPVPFDSGEGGSGFYADSSEPLAQGQICHLTFPDGVPAGLTFTCGTAVKTGENTYDVSAAIAFPKKYYRIGMTAEESIHVEATTDRIADTQIAGETSAVLSKQESCKTYFCRVTDGEGIFTDSNCFTSGHKHTWSYTLSEDGCTVTAVCKGAGTCDYSGTDKTLTISAPGALIYNGNSHDVEFGSTSFHGETIPAVSYQYKESEEGSYEDTADTKNAGFYKASFTAGEGSGAKTASVEYTVAKRSVTLTSQSASKTYDGTPLTKNEVTESGDGFVSGEGAEYTVTGSRTEVGSSKNTFTYRLKAGTKAENYEITAVEGDLTVNAAGTFTVRFEAKGGSPEPAMQIVVKDGKAAEPAEPKKTGYIFTGWYQDEEGEFLWDFDTDTVSADLTLYAGWEETEVPEYDVFFKMNGHGEQVATQSVALRHRVDRPEDPEEAGWVFVGWYKTDVLEEAWDFLCDVVTQATSLFAKWKKGDYAVRFNAEEVPDLYLPEGENIELPAAEKEGYQFEGWVDPSDESRTVRKAGETYTVTGDVSFSAAFGKKKQIGGKNVTVGDLQGPADTEGVRAETKTAQLMVREISDGKIAAGYRTEVSSRIRNIAIRNYFAEAEDADELLFGIHVRLTDVEANEDETASSTKLVYSVKPYVRALKNGVAVSDEQEVENSAIGSKVKFCLQVPTNALKYAKVEHMEEDGVTVKDTAYYEVQTVVNRDGMTEKYVEAESSSFSDFVVSFSNEKPKDPDPTPDPKPSGEEEETPKNWWNSADAGWILKPGTQDWYYVRNNALLKGWHRDSEDGYWYYLDPVTGKMLTGWLKVKEKWYYLNPAKKQQTWFKKEDGKWHYDAASANRPYGSMYQNETTPDNCKVGPDGAWIQ